LSFDTTQQDLSKLLSDAAPVVRVHIGTDRETGRSRGFAFAEYATDAEAADAIRRFDGFEFSGRRLRVNDAEDRPPARASAGPRPTVAPQAFSPSRDMYAPADPFASELSAGGGGRTFKNKGSRRGLRARKRSLGY
jgi:cold-inducible RNA-binding protein